VRSIAKGSAPIATWVKVCDGSARQHKPTMSPLNSTWAGFTTRGKACCPTPPKPCVSSAGQRNVGRPKPRPSSARSICAAPDYDKAVEWLRTSAEQNNVAGLSNLGVAYARGTGVEQDFHEAVRLFTIAAEPEKPRGDDEQKLVTIDLGSSHGCQGIR
jgi:hypothetical protein